VIVRERKVRPVLDRIRQLGPGALVAAAFIGPGTVTACTLAGARFGYALLWALLFATLATVALQEMSARLGVVTQKGLGEVLAETMQSSFWKRPLFALIGVALYMGNAAYEAGNVSGAALGVAAVIGESDAGFRISVIVISAIAASLLWAGGYKRVEAVLIALVMVMAAAFAATAVIVRPDLAALATGLTRPAIPQGGLMTVIALIGTTVVPYNLFLHASAAKAKWTSAEDLKSARADTALSVGLGGVIAVLIVSTAAASLFAAGLDITSAADMAAQLEPAFGAQSKYLLGLGFFAAGLSSAITAPLATGYAMTEIFRIRGGSRSFAFRAVALSVVIVGAGLSLTGVRPVTIIVTAQFANGLLLPVIAAFLLFAMNRKTLLGRHANGPAANLAGAVVVAVTVGLGARLALGALGLL